jgi:uncharacterized membrane protein
MDGVVYMDAEIRPNRSLSERGFIILITVITVLNCASAAVFLAMGATLVPVFLGLDVAAILAAFLLSYQAAKRVQRVQVSAREVVVTLETPKGSKTLWESPTAFTRLAVNADADQVIGLKLALSGRECPVAEALSPRERAEFARALETAIQTARRERG